MGRVDCEPLPASSPGQATPAQPRLVLRHYAPNELILSHRVEIPLTGFVHHGKVEVVLVRGPDRHVVRHFWDRHVLDEQYWRRYSSPVELRAAEPTLLRVAVLNGSQPHRAAVHTLPLLSRAERDRRSLRRVSVFLTVGLVFALIALRWQAPWRTLASRLAYGVASYQLQQGDVTQASSLLQAGLALDPRLARAHNDLGTILYGEGREADAQQAFAHAAAADPAFAVAHNNLGLVFLQLGQLSSARAALDMALALNPESAAAWANLGTVERLDGHPEEAMRAYRAALRLNPDHVVAHTNLGVLCYEQQQWDEAQQHLEAALAAQPDLPQAHMLLGDIARRRGERDRAWYHLRVAVKAMGADPLAHFYLALWYEQEQQWEAAEGDLRRVLTLDPHPKLAGLAESHLDRLEARRLAEGEEKGE